MRKLILLFVSSFALSFSLFAQVKIEGRIIDQSGEALPGVTVVEDGTNNFSVSDADGNYVLTDVDKNSTLVFSFIGMLKEEI
ncbi:MAG: carboxypeptidase-like regulatory domain-containing protein, partial [Bacteroidales bacterium]